MLIAVIFGGKSTEHGVSVATGVMTAKEVKADILPVYIDKNGVYRAGKIKPKIWWLSAPDGGGMLWSVRAADPR